MEYVMFQFENIFDQILSSNHNEDKRFIKNASMDFSFHFVEQESGTARIVPFIDNTLNYIWHYLGTDIEKVIQEYSKEKVDRLISNLNTGKDVYIRKYNLKAISMNNFIYQKVESIEITGSNQINFKFANHSRNLEELTQEINGVFGLLRDWKVYEDITVGVFNSSFNKKKIMKIYKDFILVKAVNHPLNGFEFSIYSKVLIDSLFSLYRKTIYNFLRESFPTFSFQFNELIDMLESYSNQLIDIKMFQDLLKVEQNILYKII